METVLSVHDLRILTAVNSGASSLSFVGSGFIVLCYSLFKDLRKFSFKLVFYLSLSDMLCSFFNMVGDPSKGFFCYVQDYTTHFFCVASFLWTTTIAFTLHRTVVRHKLMLKIWRQFFACMFGELHSLWLSHVLLVMTTHILVHGVGDKQVALERQFTL